MVCPHSLEKGGGEWRRAPTELPPQGAPVPSLPGEGGPWTQRFATGEGGAARTQRTQNHTTREEGAAGETAPRSLFPPQQSWTGAWPLDQTLALRQLVAPCSFLDGSWSGASSRRVEAM